MTSIGQIAITIPIYKEFDSLKESEVSSLNQCFKILEKFSIYFVCPYNLKIDGYLNHAGRSNKAQFKYFASSYFQNLKGYNLLLKSKNFFRAFSNYQCILLYQLDAWVFKDQLSEWCSKPHDYIGAPWFDGFDLPKTGNNFIQGGNGGFSIRNISSSLRILKRLHFLVLMRRLWYKYRIQSVIKFESLLDKLNGHYKIKDSKKLYEHFFNVINVNEMQEDYFWSSHIPSIFSDFRVATASESIPFSFEVNPALLFEKNDCQLPFGCHAWEKYDPEFWRNFIKDEA